jgi:simple sugar transport system permease protein
MAGIGGGYLSLVDVPYFSTEMTAGRGFIALAIVVFGKWHPVKACGAALLFSLCNAVLNRLQAIPDLGFIPYQFFSDVALHLDASCSSGVCWARQTPRCASPTLSKGIASKSATPAFYPSCVSQR